MKLSDILDQIQYKEFKGNKDTIVDNITYDSRKVSDNCIFVAIKGFEQDGHKYIKGALDKGASTVLCEYIPEDETRDVNYIVVENSRKSMALVSSILYDNPSHKMNVIGVTGTNGKTSITNLLNAVFEYANKKTASVGTLGIVINKQLMKTEHTTPESSDLLRTMKDMIDNHVEFCSMEVSSHALELDRVTGIDYNIGIFTNLTRDHLDFHHTMENYYLAKKKLFYMTRDNNIVNIDDSYGKRLYDELKNDNKKVLSYAIDSNADFKASNINTTILGSSFDLEYEGKIKKVSVKTPGNFSVLNTLATIAASYCLGFDMETIIEALEKYNGVSGRFEVLDTKLGVVVVLDFAHTPDGLEKIMQTVDEFAKGKKIVLFGAGGDRDVSRRAPMGEIAGKYCDLTILTSDNPRFEDPYSICEEIAEGVKKHLGNYKIIVEREEAIYYAIEQSQPGDIIVLAGKSTEPYQDLGIEKVPYDERTIAKRMIRKVEEEREL